MQIVIDIDDEVYNEIKNKRQGKWYCREMDNAIRQGKPLPEQHGKLVDADKMMARLCKDDCKQTNGECKYFTRCSFWDAVQEAETIIPTTKGDNKNATCD